MKFGIGTRIAALCVALVALTVGTFGYVYYNTVLERQRSEAEETTAADVRENTDVAARGLSGYLNVLQSDLDFTSKRMGFVNMVTPHLRPASFSRDKDFFPFTPSMLQEFLGTKPQYLRISFYGEGEAHTNTVYAERIGEDDFVVVQQVAALREGQQVEPPFTAEPQVVRYTRKESRVDPWNQDKEWFRQLPQADRHRILHTLEQVREGLAKVKDGQPYWGHIENGKPSVGSSPLHVLKAAAPVFGQDTKKSRVRVKGVVTITAEFRRMLTTLNNLLQLETGASPKGMRCFVTDGKGTILATGKEEEKMEFVGEDRHLQEEYPALRPAIQSPTDRPYELKLNGSGSSLARRGCFRFIWHPTRTANTSAAHHQPLIGLAEIHDVPPVQARLGPAVGISAALIVAAAALALLFAQFLTRPLKKITAAAESLAALNFDVVLPVKGGGEIGVLARAFQTMVDQLRKRGQELREREARLATILKTAADGIITTDAEGNIEASNQAAETLFGYSGEELKSRDFQDLLAPTVGMSAQAQFTELVKGQTFRSLPLDSQPEIKLEDRLEIPSIALDDGKPREMVLFRRGQGGVREVTGRRKDGSVFPLEMSVSEVVLGEQRSFTVIVRDVTERRRASEKIRLLNAGLEKRVKERTAELERANDELERANAELHVARDQAEGANRAKDLFVASVSHELRTPLNYISGFCQLLEMTPLDEDQLRDLHKIRSAGNQLLALINDILDYQKMIMGAMPLQPESFDLAVLVAETAESMEPKIKEHGNAFVVMCPPNIGSVFADRRRVSQMLLNLLSNAAKFTRQKSIYLRVSRDQANGADWITLQVQDEGKGMSPEQQAKLFAPFAKLSDQKDNPDGTGLGLTITRGIAQQMGGGIAVESTVGVGSTFSIRIPAQTAPSPAPAPPREVPAVVAPRAESPPPAAPANRARDILVVDDDPGVCDLMKRFLEARGFVIQTVSNGVQGIEQAKDRHPSAIILDVVMPGLDGWAVLATLKSDPATADIPVIMVTMTDQQERGYALGAADYITKPVNWDRLAHVLRHHLGEDRDRAILVVEDEDQAREMLRRMLERDGWSVLEAVNGRAALDQLAAGPVAMILLDLMMPVMDGFEFVEVVRQREDWKSIPIVVITAKVLGHEERERLNGRVVQIIQKGTMDRDALLQEIHERVAEHTQSRAPHEEKAWARS